MVDRDSRLGRAEVGRPRVGRGAHYNIRWRGLGTLGWLVGVSNQYLKLGRDLVEICVCNYCRSSLVPNDNPQNFKFLPLPPM